jgi:hypothetical protein
MDETRIVSRTDRLRVGELLFVETTGPREVGTFVSWEDAGLTLRDRRSGRLVLVKAAWIVSVRHSRRFPHA